LNLPWFSPTSIRRSSLRHNLRTESALHFEKGIDPNQCLEGLLRAAWLISQYGGAVDTFAPIDQYPGKIPPAMVNISLPKVREHIGKNLSHEEIKNTLNALMMKIEEIDADNWIITVPTYKTDVTRQADIIEEIVRIYGLNNIEETGKFAFSMPEKIRNEVAEARQTGLQYLADAGYSEAMGLSIINSTQWAKVTGNNDFEGVRINNTSMYN
jgi:phenylalanyl-tRNA synthetase beta chain